MKYLILVIGMISFPLYIGAQKASALLKKPDPAKEILTVEAACGQCQFGLPGQGCDLAVRIDGKAYFVQGADIDDFGDAHADDGFCQAIRTANVQGEVVNNLFDVSYFKLQKASHKKKRKN